MSQTDKMLLAGANLFARGVDGKLLVDFQYELEARQTARRWRYIWRGVRKNDISYGSGVPRSRIASNNWAIENFDNLYEGVPKWAIKEYNTEKNKLTEKSIFTDKEGIWKNLPLEILGMIMAYHSRNNNRYWGGITFCANLRKNFARSNWSVVKYDRDYNPYKNVDIFQNTTKYDWRNNEVPHLTSLEDFYRIEQSFIQQRQMMLTTYGKARDNKRAVVTDINKLMDIFLDGTARTGYTLSEKTKPASTMTPTNITAPPSGDWKQHPEWVEWESIQQQMMRHWKQDAEWKRLQTEPHPLNEEGRALQFASARSAWAGSPEWVRMIRVTLPQMRNWLESNPL